MKDKDLQELKLEEIMREFGSGEQTPPQEPAQPDPAESDPAAREDMPEEKVPENPENVPEADSEKEADPAKTAAESDPGEEPLQQEEEPQPSPETETVSAVTEETVRLDLPQMPKKKVESDTIRLDGIAKKLPKTRVRNAAPLQEPSDDTQVLDLPAREEPYSEHWEPEYEQPMGEYVPPQPIIFQPRSRLQELKRQLVAGPEKRYYALSERGFGKIQMAIFFSLIVALAAITATVIYAAGMVTEDRIKLMVFGQFFTMLISGALGIHLMMDGVTDLFHKKFTLNFMLLITFLACCIDGVFSLRTLQVPCCAAFCLQVSMALLSEYERRRVEISQMDTMRRASRLDGVAVCPDYWEGKKAFLRKEAQVEEFMDNYDAPSTHDRILRIYGLIAIVISIAIAVTAGVIHGVQTGFRVWTVTLLAALPATAFVSLTRPFAILEGRLHSLGTVLCGWKGIRGLTGKAVFPVTHDDVYPAGSVRMNGVKFYGSRKPDDVVAYAAAVISAENGGLAEVFRQALDSRNGYHFDASGLKIYDGGIGATVNKEPVLVGSLPFLKKMGVDVPEGIRVNYAVCVSIDGEFSALFAMSYDRVRSSYVGMSSLCKTRGLQPVLISSDFNLTPQFIRTMFGAKSKSFLIPSQDERRTLWEKKLEEDAPSLLLTTRPGLASAAMGITGARALHTAGILGICVHLMGGILGMGIMALLVILGALELLTPFNMFLYQMVWMVPGLLMTEWTRSL